jgi:hypothetical protein
MFRRRRGDETDEFEGDDLDDAIEDDALDGGDENGDDLDDEAAQRSRTVVPGPTTGPWDDKDLPRDDATARVDLGGLAIPLVDGIELRVEVSENVVVAAALVDGASQLVVNAFAAPKTAGLWDDVRREIAESLGTSGGSAEEQLGTFGSELRARILDGSGGAQAARFIGVDGPRWFLRGLLTGPAATDTLQARRLEEVFRGIVVVRGADAMAPRDPIALHLPREAVEQMAEPDPEDRVLELTERGPEITETQ